MMGSRGRVDRVRGRAERAGFTLLEVLAALAVLGIATGIFATLFMASMNLGHLNQSRSIAATIADEQVVLLREFPEAFEWPDFTATEPGTFSHVSPRERAASATAPPSVMPFESVAYRRDSIFYDRFSCDLYARVPSEDAGHLEIATVVHWVEKGKRQSITLTSAVPRSLAEGQS